MSVQNRVEDPGIPQLRGVGLQGGQAGSTSFLLHSLEVDHLLEEAAAEELGLEDNLQELVVPSIM